MNLKTWCVNNNREELIAEWGGFSGDRGIKTPMDEVPYDSCEYAIWNCQICERMTYLKILNRRMQEGNFKCAGCIKRENIKSKALKRKETTTKAETMVRTIQSSLPEQYIYYYLKQEPFEVLRGVTFDWLGRSSLDLYLPEFSLAIEYDGLFWHKNKQNDDANKTKICLKNGIDIIRIRESSTPIRDKSILVVMYEQNKDYSNIDIPIFKIIDYLNKNHNLALEYPDINIKRDKQKITEIIACQAKKKTIAYIWPEIYEYWDYEKNEGILPQDVVKSTNLFFVLKCPYCGESYNMKPRYYKRSMLQCQCEYNLGAYKSYYSYLQYFYNINGNLEIKESSLLARRALDWIDLVIKRQRYKDIPRDEVKALRDIGLEWSYEENPNYITPLFRKRSKEEQIKYDQYQIQLRK